MIKKMLLIGAIGFASLVSVKMSTVTAGTGATKKVSVTAELCGVKEAQAECNPAQYPVYCACGCCYECERWQNGECWGCN